MTDNDEHGLPENVLEQAAEAFLNEYTTYGDGMLESGKAGLRAALPILMPAIERQLIEYMAKDAKATELHLCTRYDNGDFDVVDETLEEWVAFYFPTATEGATDAH